MKWVIIVVILLLCFTGATAQYKNPFFYTISVENGLPYMDVQASLQDKFGYLWLGTENGLVRYDGYRAKQYTMPDAYDQPIKFYLSIADLYEDSRGTLWAVISFRGYYYYDRENDTFLKASKTIADTSKMFTDADNIIKYVHDDKRDINWVLDVSQNGPTLGKVDMRHLSLDTFSASGKDRHFIPCWHHIDLAVGTTGSTWLVTDSLLSLYDTGTKSYKPWFVAPGNSRGISLWCVEQDPADPQIIWLATRCDGKSCSDSIVKLYSVNTKTKAYTAYGPQTATPFTATGNCQAIFTDALKRTWFATDHGISLFDRQSGRFINYPILLPGNTDKDVISITKIVSDSRGNLWIGGSFNSLVYLDVKKATTSLYTHTSNPGSLPDFSGTIKIYSDHSGIIWADLYPVGTVRLDQHKSFFNATNIDPPFRESDRSVTGATINMKGRYDDTSFFVSRNNNLYIWNYKRNTFQPAGSARKIAVDAITCALLDKEGLIWMGTNGDGVYSYNMRTNKTSHYRHDPADPSSISSNSIAAILEDNDKNIWLGTRGGGLSCFYKQTSKFKNYPFVLNDGTILNIKDVLSDAFINSLFYDREGILWIGTLNGGLDRLDIRTGLFRSFHDFKNGLDAIRIIFEDSQKRLWVGTNMSGLLLVDKETGDFEQYSARRGLAADWVKSIAEDNNGNIWVATTHGLSRVDPVHKNIVNYGLDNGLPVVNTEKIYKGAGGIFYVAFKNGLFEFDPCNIDGNKVPPGVVIESFSYNNADGTKGNATIYTYGHQNATLHYNENKITFQYVALHYANSALNQYSCKLEGLDKDWVPVGTERSVTYNNLSPGKYTFRVKAANSDGVWNEQGASFTFTISPPWWKTWWAYCIYGILFITALRIFTKWREHNLRMEKEKLERTVEERTAEVVAEKKEVEKQKTVVEKEKQRSDELLLNILPEEVAEELKAKGNAEAKLIDEATVLFTDFKGFTQLSEKLSPKALVAEINECFSAFDLIMQKYGVEKIKTIGDSYMAAGGLPTPNKTHPEDVVRAALEIQQFMQAHKLKKTAAGELFFEIRIGVHTGPVVAGIVGVKKFQYDIWGDTVNTASRMESSGGVGRVNISQTTYELVKDKFTCEYRGEIDAKGKGAMKMYYIS